MLDSNIDIYIIYQNWVVILVKFVFFNFNFTKHYNFFIYFYMQLKKFIIFQISILQ